MALTQSPSLNNIIDAGSTEGTLGRPTKGWCLQSHLCLICLTLFLLSHWLEDFWIVENRIDGGSFKEMQSIRSTVKHTSNEAGWNKFLGIRESQLSLFWWCCEVFMDPSENFSLQESSKKLCHPYDVRNLFKAIVKTLPKPGKGCFCLWFQGKRWKTCFFN